MKMVKTLTAVMLIVLMLAAVPASAATTYETDANNLWYSGAAITEMTAAIGGKTGDTYYNATKNSNCLTEIKPVSGERDVILSLDYYAQTHNYGFRVSLVGGSGPLADGTGNADTGGMDLLSVAANNGVTTGSNSVILNPETGEPYTEATNTLFGKNDADGQGPTKQGMWHNAVFCFFQNEQQFRVYLDGVEYLVPLAEKTVNSSNGREFNHYFHKYGIARIQLFTYNNQAGTMLFDNIKVQTMAAVDTADTAAIANLVSNVKATQPVITAVDGKSVIDGSTIKLEPGRTVEYQKAAVTAAGSGVDFYTVDNGVYTKLEDSAIVPDGCKMIASGVDATGSARTYAEYTVKAPVFESSSQNLKYWDREQNKAIDAALYTITGFNSLLTEDEVAELYDGEAVTIPAAIDGNAVEAIGANAFYSSDSKYNNIDFKLPSDLKYIAGYAFRNTGITFLTVEGYCDTQAFRGCSKLTNITFTDKFTASGAAVFYSTPVTEVDMTPIPTRTGGYSKAMFQYCSKLETLKIKNTVTDVGYLYEGMVANCPKLKTIEIYPGDTGSGITYNIFAAAYEDGKMVDVNVPVEDAEKGCRVLTIPEGSSVKIFSLAPNTLVPGDKITTVK